MKYESEEELNTCMNRTVKFCLKQLDFESGVIEGFEWVLNEITGNVFDHSGENMGWLQTITYTNNHKLTLTVCDTGIGIPNTIRKTFPNFRKDEQAIEYSLRKGVTSNKEGQGNGLAGATEIARLSKKSNLSIASGKGRVIIQNGKVEVKRLFPSFVGTCFDLQLSTEIPIDLEKALGHMPMSYSEYLESDEGYMEFRLRDHSLSFGNRVTGEKLRNMFLNIRKQNPDKTIRIDMDEIGIISSSFADEFFGRLFVSLGPISFGSMIKFKNLNSNCKAIIDDVVSQRLAQNYYKGGGGEPRTVPGFGRQKTQQH